MSVIDRQQTGRKINIDSSFFPTYNTASFDDRLTRIQAKDEPGLFFLNNPCPLFIDEVQKETAILEDIKLRVDRSNERGQFIFSCSSKAELMKGVSESLADRVSIAELSGLSMRELHKIDFNMPFVPSDEYLSKRKDSLVEYNDIWTYIHNGFYPELYDIGRDWMDFYSSYVSTYLERDINKLISADSITFTRFMTAVAARTGEMLNYRSIANATGVSEPTIKSWISILERTGIVTILQPYSASALTRAIKTQRSTSEIRNLHAI